ncbi:MAG: PEGA domain-containing protein [Polyangiaceae bacterium]|nr:PEGA domain-containing protein [Polyangiaceae bacterium]
MRGRASRIGWGSAVCGASLLFASAAWAQPAAAPADATAKARALFDAGGRAYDRGQFDVALEAFEQAYGLVKRDGLLFSMAQAHRRLFNETRAPSHRDEAIRLYREFLSLVQDGKRRAEANKWLGELEGAAGSAPKPATPATPIEPAGKKTRLYVSSMTEGATVSVDGGAEAPANKALEIAPGKHTLVIRAPGHFEEKLEVDAAANELSPITAELRERPGAVEIATTSGADLHVGGRFVGEAPLASALELIPGRHVVVAELTGHKSKSVTLDVPRAGRVTASLTLETTTQRDLSYVVFAMAGAAAITSGVTTGFAFQAQSTANELLDQQKRSGLEPEDLAAYEGAREDRGRLVIGAAVTGGAAGALLITGLGLFLVDPPERLASTSPDAGPRQPADKEEPAPLDEVSILPAVGPDGGMVSLAWRF